jgi:uncharacterized protein (TIGR02118 family)
MTAKLTVLYPRPDDPKSFDEHYYGHHMPLARTIPGLQRAETAKFDGTITGGDSDFYLIAELWFDDADAVRAAFATEEGKKTAADAAGFSPPGTQMLVSTLD